MKLINYIKYKKIFYFGFVFKMFEVVLELFLPIFMAMLMNEGLKANNFQAGLKYTLIILGFAFLGYLTTLFSQYAAAKSSIDFAKNIREETFNHLMDISLKDSEKLSSSTLINRLSMDVNNLQNSLAMTVRTASRAPVLMIGSIISLFILNKKIALVLVIGLPILILLLTVVMYISIYYFKKYQKENDNLSVVVSDNIEGAKMIRSFAKVEDEELRFKRRNDVLSNIMIKLGRVTSLSNPMTILILNVLLVIMLYFGIINVNNGLMDDTQLLQIINYITQLSFAIIAAMNLILIYTKAATSKIRIQELLDLEDTILNDEDDILLNDNNIKIEFKNVSFTYDNNLKPVISNLNLVINPGEVVGIVGLTGSGKTTIVDLLLRFYDVTEGEILINDINIKRYNIESLRNNIAYAEQKPILLASNIYENIVMSSSYSDSEIDNAINNSQATFIYDKELGVASEVSRDGSNFSGGQRQRIALARSLVKDSKVLILDDVFSALDYVTDLKIRKNLDKSNQTKIFISQRLSSLTGSNKIVVINNSEITGIGTHEELLKSNELYLNLYKTQTYGGVN